MHFYCFLVGITLSFFLQSDSIPTPVTRQTNDTNYMLGNGCETMSHQMNINQDVNEMRKLIEGWSDPNVSTFDTTRITR